MRCDLKMRANLNEKQFIACKFIGWYPKLWLRWRQNVMAKAKESKRESVCVCVSERESEH